MCKQHGTDDEIKNSEMIKPKEAMFYFNNEKEDGDDSFGSCEEDETDEDPFYHLREKISVRYLSNSPLRSQKLRYHGKSIFFSRHGESEYNVENKVGGDCPLSERGECYAQSLGRYFNSLDIKHLTVWTSKLQRTESTAAYVNATERKKFSSLNEIDAGNFDGLSYEDIEELYPEEFEKRLEDKLGYRYPGGESYIDCCHRLVPFLEEFEQLCHEAKSSSAILVVAHQAILRCIFGYLLKSKVEEIPFIKIPQHTVIQVTWLPKYDLSAKLKACEMDTSESSKNPSLHCIEEVCSIEYVRMPIEHVEQGNVRLPE